MAATGLLMATWWITEALPIPITALVPLVLFPVLGTAVMLLPVGLSVLELAHVDKDNVAGSEHRNFALALMLAIAYACNIGGLGTLIGTPPNALLAGFMNATYGVEIGFAQWMLIGLPTALTGLVAAHFLLTRVLFPPAIDTLPGGDALIAAELGAPGPTSAPERRVAVVFGGDALLWMTRPLLEDWVPGLWTPASR